MDKVKTGILGAGHMSGKIMYTMHKVKNIKPVAIASRSKERAEKFAKKHKLEKSYGSYMEMLKDPEIDLVYIATPPSEHFKQMKMCLEMGKAVFCEKPFTITAQEAEEILKFAEEKHIFAGEAVWTRYMPLYKEIKKLRDLEEIGTITAITANLGYPVWERERVRTPELGGGALFDVGVYPLTFVDAIAGMDYSVLHTVISKSCGVDQVSAVIMSYPSGIVVSMLNSITGPSDRQGIIYGTEGYAVVENINNYEGIRIYNKEHQCIKEILPPVQISGYEYELEAAARAVLEGKEECEEMPHSGIIKIMKVMEDIHMDIKKQI